MVRKKEAMRCATCGGPCDGPHLVIIPTMVDGATRVTGGTVAFCRVDCFRKWANRIVWES